MRHRIVHNYLNVDEEIVWEVIQQDLPNLVSILRKICLLIISNRPFTREGHQISIPITL